MALSVERGETSAASRPMIAVDDVEIQLLLEGLVQVTGYNFRDYDPALIRRRIEAAMAEENVSTVSGLQAKVLHDPASLERLLMTLCMRRSVMFAEPDSLNALRSLVIPLLRTYPFLRIWHVSCANGEETYSLAMLLTEEGLYERCKIYATDAVESGIDMARAGTYSSESTVTRSANYAAAGGVRSLGDYVTTQSDLTVSVDPSLRKNIVFARHNVVSDASFNEFHLIVCSHVLSQFTVEFQSRIHRLLHGSLVRLGFLMLGNGESMQNSPNEQFYRRLGDAGTIYRRMR
jgi:chemotaxis protein methyltransferase CheR